MRQPSVPCFASAAVIIAAIAAVARADGYLWLSAENSSPTAIYRYNLSKHTIDLVR